MYRTVTFGSQSSKQKDVISTKPAPQPKKAFSLGISWAARAWGQETRMPSGRGGRDCPRG